MPTPHRCRPRAWLRPSADSAATPPAPPELPRTRAAASLTRSSAALFHAANAPGILPSELSPPRRAVPPRRRSLLPCGFILDAVRGAEVRGCPTGFVRAPTTLPVAAREGRGTTRGPGTRVPRDRQAAPVRARVAAHAVECDRLEPPGSPLRRRNARFEALLPSRSPFSRSRVRRAGLRQRAGYVSGPLLSWAFAPPELSPPRPRVRSTVAASGEPGATRRPRPALED